MARLIRLYCRFILNRQSGKKFRRLEIKRIVIHIALACLLVLVTTAAPAFSQIRLVKTEINPLNRVTFYFSESPRDFSSDLSAEKTVILLSVKNVSISPAIVPISGSGIISSVRFNKSRNQVDIALSLSDKRGYTITPLPYSKALSVEVFDWKNLNASEDSYRTALLALEEGITSSAKKALETAVKSGNANAAANLGIIYLGEGNIDKALETLKLAERNNSNINDLYAALSQAYRAKGDLDLSDKYRQLFIKKTGLGGFQDISTTSPATQADNAGDPPSVLDLLAEGDTSAANKSMADSASTASKNDTLVMSRKLKQTENHPAAAKTSKPASKGLSTVLIYISLAALLMAMLLVSSYLRWKKQQIAKRKKPENKKFEDNLAKAKTSMTGSALAASLYKKASTAGEAQQKKEKAPGQQTKPAENKKQAEKPDASQQEVALSLERLAREILAAKSQESQSPSQPKPAAKDKSPLSAKIELALHLQQEQDRIKEKNMLSLSESNIPTDVSKVAEVARKLGIEKGAIEARKNISDIKDNDNILLKLTRKFNVNKNDSQSAD